MANFIGIDRGVDLPLCISVLTLVTYIGYSFGKFRHLEKRIAILVKEVSLARGEEKI